MTDYNKPMADTLDLQSEQFMTLLTDALRSGPGSPEWNQAVKTLRASDQNIDEYTLLYAARERLESGKEYRAVRAGPNFTRKVLDGIDEQANASGGIPTANLIAMIAAGVILAVVVVIGVFILKGSNPQQQAIEELARQIFGNKILSASFAGPASTTPVLPDGWTKFGDLPLVVKSNELRPSTMPASLPATTEPASYKTGGLVTAASIPADQSMEVDVTIRICKAGDEGIAEVFVSDEPITDENATGGHALVWQFKAGEARVFLPDGRPDPHGEKFGTARDLPVKILLNRDIAVIDTAGQRLYAGPHLLAPDRARYVGIRFRRRAGDKGDHLGAIGITLQKP